MRNCSTSCIGEDQLHRFYEAAPSSFGTVIAVVIGAFLTGWLIRSRMTVPPQLVRNADLYVVKFALPVLVFSKISRMSMSTSMLSPVVLAWSVMLSCVAVVLLAARRLQWDATTTGALLMVGVLGNTSFLGLGMVEGLLGTDHVTTAVAYDQLGTSLVYLCTGRLL